MKKLFLAMSVVALVAFMAGPSSALVGMPDDVPGTHVLLPFFLVSIPGVSTSGDNTLAVLTEVKGLATSVAWTVRDKKSIHRGDGVIKLTPYDVYPMSVYAVLTTELGVAGLAALEIDLEPYGNPDGINDHWFGYIDFINGNVALVQNQFIGADNLIAHMYQVDLLNGMAAGTTIPARESAPRSSVVEGIYGCVDGMYRASQNTFVDLEWIGNGNLPWLWFTDFEVYTAFALRESKEREKLCCATWANPDWIGIPDYFRLMPRFYLHDPVASENLIFLWSSGNWGQWEQGGMFDPDTYWLTIWVIDEAENLRSGQINIPYEVNIIDVRQVIPQAWLAGRIGGWLNIEWDYEFANAPLAPFDYPWALTAVPMAVEWLAYSWQTVQGAVPAVNWSSLYAAHRDVGQWVHWFTGDPTIPCN